MAFNQRPIKEEKPFVGNRQPQQHMSYEHQNNMQSRLMNHQATPNVRHRNNETEFGETFMKHLAEYKPVIPEEVTRYYMRNNGLGGGDPLISKLISVATQKFISDILLDAQQLAKSKQTPAQRRANDRLSLTPELLDQALKERGIQILRSPYNH